MTPRPGATLVSTTDDTVLLVVRWGGADAEVTCGGAPMVEGRASDAGARQAADPAQQDGTQLGKRYASDDGEVELLCTKAGTGTVAINGTPVSLKTAKPLPASD
ncbi:MAG TPA: hypothetical protein VHC18_07665 [Amycolatopsis sp.]|nr:hypothetical protein [Amycolatopsis sp.]